MVTGLELTPSTVTITSTPRALVSRSTFRIGSIFAGLKKEIDPWLMEYLLLKRHE